MTQGSERFTLLDALSKEMFQFPFAVMRDVGPAVQTLAGLVKITKKETFVPVANIANKARLPEKTCRRHMTLLEDAGWITNAGRQPTRVGAMARRTCTIRVTRKTVDAFTPGAASDAVSGPTYGLLPWWSAAKFKRGRLFKNLPWSARALLSLLMAKLASLKSAFEPGVGKTEVDEEDFWLYADNYFSEGHWEFSIAKLQAITGLSKHSVIDGKRLLEDWGFINKRCDRRRVDDGFNHDLLEPNRDFYCLETAASPGRCYLNIDDWRRKSA